MRFAPDLLKDIPSPGGIHVFRSALNALSDGVLIVDESRRVICANKALAALWEIPAELLANGSDAALLAFLHNHLADPESAVRYAEWLQSSEGSFEDEVLLKNGRILSRRSARIEHPGDTLIRIWIYSDVTDARHAHLDPLTGLPNRRAYMRDFPAFTHAPAEGMARGVAILDVDNFKRYNDIYGHADGDEILSHIGRVLRFQLHQPDDLVFRIGGEEFLLGVYARTNDGVLATFERIRAGVVAMARKHEGNPPHDVVSVSIGVGTFHGPREPQDVFTAVDQALYQAKQGGRNQLVHVEI